MTVELYLGDCLEILPTIETGSIGKMGFTTNIHGGVTLRNDYKGRADWDVAIDERHFAEMFRVSIKQLIFGGNFYSLRPSRCWLIWDKKNSGQFSNDFADVEMAWTSLDKPARLIHHTWHGMIQQNMKYKEKRYHPTQKPVAVMMRAIEMMTDIGDTVLDPFMGSGTTGVACVKTDRSFIGIEIDKDYFDIAKSRIESAQPRLL